MVLSKPVPSSFGIVVKPRSARSACPNSRCFVGSITSSEESRKEAGMQRLHSLGIGLGKTITPVNVEGRLALEMGG